MKKVLIVLGIAGAATGIFLYYKKQVELLQQFTYKIIGIAFPKIGLQESICRLTIRIFSDSAIQAEVSDMNLDVYIEGVLVGNIRETKPIIVPSKGYSDIGLSVAFSPLEIGRNAIDLITDFATKRDALIDVKGFMKVKSGFIKTSVPFEYQTTFKEQFSS